MSRRTTVGWVGVVMLFLMLVLIVTTLRMSFEVGRKLDSLAVQRLGKTCLPLPSIPLRLIHENPVCAQRVLEAMNVTNVRIRPIQKPHNRPSSLRRRTLVQRTR